MTSEAVRKWAAKGSEEVLLPSGMLVRLRIRSAVELIRDGTLPNTLRDKAVAYEQGTVDARSLSPEEQIAAYDFMREFCARAVVAIQDAEADVWEPVRLTKEDLAEVPEADVNEIQAYVTLRKTARQITADSRVKMGQAAIAEAASREEEVQTTPAWEEFRRESGGDTAGADGNAVREVARSGLPPG